MTEHDDAVSRELESLEAEYRRSFPNADSFPVFCFGPERLVEILRNANGREIVFSYPGLADSIVDGGEYSYKEVVRNPLTLQELLYARGLPKDRVKLVRHRDTSGSLDLHKLYRTDQVRFLDYQRQQGNRVFHDCDYVVSCLGEPGGRARFVGVYRVHGVERETDEHYYYSLTEVADFDDLKERVLIDWGKAAISWQQWLRSEIPKLVLEIQPRPFAEAFKPFKDYLDFTLDFAELQQLVQQQGPQDEWWRMLSAVAGIYLILDKVTGKQYIGSAYGAEGVWQRWVSYEKTGGHGNNVQLKQLLASEPAGYANNFQFTLLMTLPKTMTSQEVIKREALFKQKFGSLAFGLNSN